MGKKIKSIAYQVCYNSNLDSDYKFASLSKELGNIISKIELVCVEAGYNYSVLEGYTMVYTMNAFGILTMDTFDRVMQRSMLGAISTSLKKKKIIYEK